MGNKKSKHATFASFPSIFVLKSEKKKKSPFQPYFSSDCQRETSHAHILSANTAAFCKLVQTLGDILRARRPVLSLGVLSHQIFLGLWSSNFSWLSAVCARGHFRYAATVSCDELQERNSHWHKLPRRNYPTVNSSTSPFPGSGFHSLWEASPWRGTAWREDIVSIHSTGTC